MLNRLLHWIASLNGSEPETEQPEEPEFYMGSDWEEKREEAQARARHEWNTQ